jgi:hypothetical protein
MAEGLRAAHLMNLLCGVRFGDAYCPYHCQSLCAPHTCEMGGSSWVQGLLGPTMQGGSTEGQRVR